MCRNGKGWLFVFKCFSIPSTIGSACDSKEQLEKNLNLAIDVYIKRVEGAPCGNGNVDLFKGSFSGFVQHAKDRRPKLLTFLRGTKKERKTLKREATLYSYFEEVWDVRSRHMLKNLPEQCVFMLIPCFQKGRPHLKCQEGEDQVGLKWLQSKWPISGVLSYPDPRS